MIGIYLIGSFSIAISLFFCKNKNISFGLLGLFLVLQWILTTYGISNIRSTDLGYFTYDPLAILLLITISIIAVPALFHSHIYLNDQPAPPATRSIYYGAIVLLISAISAGYLACIS